MTTVLFIHSAGPQGAGEGSSALVAALRKELPADWTFLAPLMPAPDAPKAAGWIAACKTHIAAIEDDLVIVGHSLGGSTLLQVFSEIAPPRNLMGVVLIAAPFWSAKDWNVAEFALQQGAEIALDRLPRLILLQGDRDDVVPGDHQERYRTLLPGAKICVLPGVDHEAVGAAPSISAALHGLVRPKL